MSDSLHRVGLISDPHGLMRPEALATLRDSALIIHCGDVGDSAVLEVLQTLAPVRAIPGNNDKGGWACSLPACDLVEVGSHKIYVLHNLADLDLHPAEAGFTLVGSAHSPMPQIRKRGQILLRTP